MFILFYRQQRQIKYTSKISSVLLENCKAELAILDLRYLLQVPMDGSTTNWKFYEIMLGESEDLDAYITMSINACSCGLHKVHGGFKYGVVKTGCVRQADAPTIPGDTITEKRMLCSGFGVHPSHVW